LAEYHAEEEEEEGENPLLPSEQRRFQGEFWKLFKSAIDTLSETSVGMWEIDLVNSLRQL
jgi:hypothetical protein